MSGEPNWTAGPWSVVKRQDGSRYFTAGDPKRGAHEAWDIDGENEATLRLITAAPDLYAALVAMVETYWEQAKDYEPPPSMVQAAYRAIAKARGE